MWSVMSDVCVLVFLTMRSWAAGSSPSDLLTFSVDTPTLLTPPTALHRSTHTHTQKLLIWLVKIKRLRLFVLHKLNFLNIMSVHIVAQRCCWYFFITIIKNQIQHLKLPSSVQWGISSRSLATATPLSSSHRLSVSDSSWYSEQRQETSSSINSNRKDRGAPSAAPSVQPWRGRRAKQGKC